METKYYIIRTGQGYREVVDEYDTRKEANTMVQEYIISDPSASYVVASHNPEQPSMDEDGVGCRPKDNDR